MSALPVDGPRVAVPRGDGVVLPFPGVRARARPPSRPGALRITRRGRLTITLLICTIVAAAGLSGASTASAGPARSAAPTTGVVVLPGDTLWSIADSVSAPGDDVRDVIAEILELNGLKTSAVFAGQELTVPLPD